MAWEACGIAWIVILALMVVSMARETWHQFRCSACRTAAQAVRVWHPDWKVFGASHRATEPDRDVVAVFYMPPGGLIEPSPYRLVVVRRNGAAEELPDDFESPYAIRGRK